MSLPLHELDHLKRWGNHAELARKLRELGLVSDLSLLQSHVHIVGSAWFRLGTEHLSDAQASLTPTVRRAAYSRAYYAAYNFSKAVRFIVNGSVSMKGDDHQSVGNLPSDLPDHATWGRDLEVLYEHRLRADYDNWTNTVTSYSLSPAECVTKAADFHDVTKRYLLSKVGLSL